MINNRGLNILSIRQHPELAGEAIAYFQQAWPSVWPIIYENCIQHCLTARDHLPQWYLLQKDSQTIGCAGLITNDFISRVDLYPWLVAVFIDEAHRGNAYATLLMDKAKADAKSFGYKYLYLSTEHVGYYEKYGFSYIGQGYHPWKEESRIYEIEV